MGQPISWMVNRELSSHQVNCGRCSLSKNPFNISRLFFKPNGLHISHSTCQTILNFTPDRQRDADELAQEGLRVSGRNRSLLIHALIMRILIDADRANQEGDHTLLGLRSEQLTQQAKEYIDLHLADTLTQ